MRFVRDSAPNRYMVLLQFDSQKQADSFYMQYNGKQFSSLDPEDCKAVFVSHVEISSDDGLVQSPISLSATAAAVADEMKVQLIELPTCPVCLERLDAETSGVLTTMCNHRFHADCLMKWGYSSCPVCRYSFDAESQCADCGTKEKLWICLICGNIGCGRYAAGHAQLHFDSTKHNYAMEVETQRVWDYMGDNYVHRLVQNKTDGKLVEIPNPENKQDAELMEAQLNSKMDSIVLEYNQLLANQLAGQRVYYESLLQQMEKEKDSQIDNILRETVSLREERKKLSLQTERLKEKQKEELKEREFLKNINETLAKNQHLFKDTLEQQEKKFEKKLAEKDNLLKDLQEQVADLMMHFQTQNKVQKDPNLQQASITIAPAPLGSSPDMNKKKKRSKK